MVVLDGFEFAIVYYCDIYAELYFVQDQSIVTVSGSLFVRGLTNVFFNGELCVVDLAKVFRVNFFSDIDERNVYLLKTLDKLEEQI